ncbi:MAG: hypothetical protein ACYTFW_23930 [Planctomycetota bacterium]|jgi:hypothetical protein
MSKSPVRPYKTITLDGGTGTYVNRIMIGVPTTGVIRMEWHQSNVGMIIPVNWSQVTATEPISGYTTYNYQVADAQNVLVKKAIERDFEWLLLYEHDVLPPPDAFIKLNKYMKAEDTPVISGLYYTRGRPSEPLIFRGRGDGVYDKFTIGDKVWASGVPTGFLLIHMGIIREMWKESPEYQARNVITRRVFETPRRADYNPEMHQFSTFSGTSDLEWCNRVMEGGYFKKAGWTKYQRKKYPFLVDTEIFCRHINIDGEQFP